MYFRKIEYHDHPILDLVRRILNLAPAWCSSTRIRGGSLQGVRSDILCVQCVYNVCTSNSDVRKKPVPLFYISMWAYRSYKAIQRGQLCQGGLTVLHNSTCDIYYIKMVYQSVISVPKMTGLHTKQTPYDF